MRRRTRPEEAAGSALGPEGGGGRTVWSVSTLNRSARDLLESGFASVWVEGELSNVARPRSGHVYFSLKDASAQVRCAMWRSFAGRMAFAPEEGMAVLCRARVSLYEARGDFQLIVEFMEQAGEGRLRQAFEQLKARLDREGLFAAEAKQPVPRLPGTIGVVTSPTGAALRDILHILERRFPAVGVIVYPTRVQGDGAAGEIVAALAAANRRRECDVVILARGGGSLEDLWPFNEEAVARAIRASDIPVIAGVGHEVDVTIADLAADLRAPTPSGAAELAVPDASEWDVLLERMGRRLAGAALRGLQAGTDKLKFLDKRLTSSHPGARLAQQSQRIDDLEQRLTAGARATLGEGHNRLLTVRGRLEAGSPMPRIQTGREQVNVAALRLSHRLAGVMEGYRTRLTSAARALHTVSPLATLDRGYAIAYAADGRILTDAADASRGERLKLTLARGQLDTEVLAVTRAGPESGSGSDDAGPSDPDPA